MNVAFFAFSFFKQGILDDIPVTVAVKQTTKNLEWKQHHFIIHKDSVGQKLTKTRRTGDGLPTS